MTTNVEFLKKQLMAMEGTSEAFEELYHAMSKKYFSEIPTPNGSDDWEGAAKLIHLYLDASGGNYEPQVIFIAKVIELIAGMEMEGGGPKMAKLEFKNKNYYVRVATREEQLEEMVEALAEAVKGAKALKDKQR